MQCFIKRVLATAVLAAGFSSAHAGPYSDLFIFGDSISDTGNLNAISPPGTIPSPPYFNGTLSNGPQWVSTLASGLGLAGAATASVFGGNNYAIAGARTDTTGFNGSLTGVQVQLAVWGNPANKAIPLGGTSVLGNGYAAADPNALYVLMAGANDLRDSRNAHPTAGAVDTAARATDATTTLSNLAAEMTFLRSRGVKNLLISSVPDLGLSPEAGFLNLRTASSEISNLFNAGIPGLAAYGLSIGLDVTVLDLAGLMQTVVDDATNNGGAQFGITNVTAPCGNFPGSAGASCDVSLFSDPLHPSARAHQLIGGAALRALGVPEPQSLLLVALAMVALVAMRRRV